MADLNSLPPGPGWAGSLRYLLRLRTGDMRHYEDLFHRYGDTVRLKSPTRGDIFTAFHPSDVERVLVKRRENFPKGQRYAELALVLGQGLVNSDGALWRRQRRMVKKPFDRPSTLALVPMICRHTENLLQRWDQAGGEFVTDVNDDMLDVTFNVAGEAFFGTALTQHTELIRSSFKYALWVALRRMYSLVSLPVTWPLPSHIRFHHAMSRIDEVIYDIIDSYREHTGPPNVLVKLMNTVDEETGEKMSRRQLRDEIDTILMVGHETSSVTAVWGLYQLCQQPEVTRRLVEEIDDVLGGDDPTAETLERMPYLNMVFKECLRLMPSVPFVLRAAQEEDVLGGYRVTAGSTVVISPWVTHRHPEFWSEPERFVPERFGDTANDMGYAFLPFGAGPRICLGQFMAQLEGKIILAKVLQRYQLRLQPDFDPKCRGFISLQPVNGMKMICKPRQRQRTRTSMSESA